MTESKSSLLREPESRSGPESPREVGGEPELGLWSALSLLPHSAAWLYTTLLALITT